MTLEEQRRILRDRGICVIIPTYNNAGTVADVTRRAMEQCDDVIVVCDGCTDDTLERLGALENSPVVIGLESNRGKGAALRTGFRHALEAGFSYAVTLDGDGQHFPEDIPLMLKANQEHPGALIVGERKNLSEAERSGGSKFANSFSNFWFAVQTWHYLRDTQTGFRLYPLKKLHLLSCLTSRYEAELELLVLASWHGVELVSVPVNVYYPPKEERVSHFRPVRDFARISVLNIVLCAMSLVYGLPLRLFRWLMTIVRTVYSLLLFVLFTTILATPLWYLYLHIGGVTEKKKLQLHHFIRNVARFVLKVHGIPGVRFTMDNPYGEDFSRPAVIICNHQSHLDLLPMLLQTDRLVVLTTDWVWKSPLYGYIVRNADFLPGSEGIEKLLPRFRALAENGFSIAIYPEGTRSEDCSIGRFHQGAFRIAQELGMDIVPMVLYGAGRALPKKSMIMRKWPIHVEIDRRITAGELGEMGGTTLEQASAMRRYYRRRYSEIADRIERDV